MIKHNIKPNKNDLDLSKSGGVLLNASFLLKKFTLNILKLKNANAIKKFFLTILNILYYTIFFHQILMNA